MSAAAASTALPLVYACSGCSSAAQMANWIALELDRLALAEMSCIAGVGGDVPSLVRVATSGRPIVVLDGCRLRCAAACLARHDVSANVDVNLAVLGVQRNKHTPFDPIEARRALIEVVRRLRLRCGQLESLMHAEHVRLDALLTATVADVRGFDAHAWEDFKAALLRHIAIEETILLPDARRRRSGDPLPIAAQLHVEHATLTALLLPPPDRDLIDEIRAVLAVHQVREEGPDGLYAAVEAAAGPDLIDLLDQVRSFPNAPGDDAPRSGRAR